MLERICDNCMSRVQVGLERCPKCGIRFENTNPGGALPNGWVLGGRYTVGRYIEIDGEGVTYSAIDANTLQRVTVKEFMPVTLCSTRDESGSIVPKPGCEVLYKTTRMDYADLYANLLRLGLVEGLAQVLDVLEENNTVYAVIEKVEGPTLSEYLTKSAGPIEHARALAMMRPVMIGVEAMHNASIIHRGISPDNIILESGGTAKLCGFATLALRQQGSELKAKLYSGYSAPEQYAASEFEGRYTDIYALGAVLYRMLTGAVPDAANERKMQDALRPPKAANKEIPGFVSAGIARAMRIVAAERIQNVPDLRLALSGEGGGGAKGPLGLSKQQMIIGISAIVAVVILVLIILIVSLVSGGKKDNSSSITSSSESVVSTKVPDFVGRVYVDVVKSGKYVDFKFGNPTEEFSATVEQGLIISQKPDAGTEYDGKTEIVFVVSKGVEPIIMPDFISTATKQEDAERRLKELGLEFTVSTEENDGKKDAGTVLRTDPQAGTEVRPGKDKVRLFVAGEQEKVLMPDLTNYLESEAKSELDKRGLASTVREAENTVGPRASGRVSSTDPVAGTEVQPNSTTVVLRIFGKFYMPNLDKFIGKAPQDLFTFLEEHGIPYSKGAAVPTTDKKNDGKVATIDYTRNAEVTADTKVVISLYSYTPPASTAPPVSSDSNLGPEG